MPHLSHPSLSKIQKLFLKTAATHLLDFQSLSFPSASKTPSRSKLEQREEWAGGGRGAGPGVIWMSIS